MDGRCGRVARTGSPATALGWETADYPVEPPRRSLDFAAPDVAAGAAAGSITTSIVMSAT